MMDPPPPQSSSGGGDHHHHHHLSLDTYRQTSISDSVVPAPPASSTTPLMSRLMMTSSSSSTHSSTAPAGGLTLSSSSSTNKVPSGLRKHPFFQGLRLQLSEQVRSLEQRLEGQLCLTGELAEYFRRRGDIEAEIGKTLDKHHRKELNHKIGQRRPEWILPSTLGGVMGHLVNETRKEAKERLVLGEICAHIAARLHAVSDDLNRVFKQCQSVLVEGQDELVQVLQELYGSSKAHERYAGELKQAEAKLRTAEAQKHKIETQLVGTLKADKSKKLKNSDKDVQKRLRKWGECRYSAAKARNEYVLCMDAAEAAVHKYFVDDLSDIIDCMDLGYYESVTCALRLYVAGEEVVRDSVQNNIDQLGKLLAGLDTRVDKQKFLEANNSFVMPKRVALLSEEHQNSMLLPAPPPPPQQTTETTSASAAPAPTTGSSSLLVPPSLDLEVLPTLEHELVDRVSLLDRRLASLRAESNELWKTLESAEGSLLSLIKSCDVSDKTRDWFVGNSNKDIPTNAYLNAHKLKRTELEQFHVNKYRDFMLSTNRLSRLQAKWERISNAVVAGDNKTVSATATAATTRRPSVVAVSSSVDHHHPQYQNLLVHRKRIGASGGYYSGSSNHRVRLFGGSLQEYLDANKVQIPTVLKSCVRVLNLFGLHHQGIFRVSGSQVEINNFRDAFERGEDPLAEMNADNASDINSVAGLLKLYLRELREPLFPIVFFDIFMEIAKLEDSGVFVDRLRDLLVKSLPRPVFIVTRYLFHFLNHLSEYSDENMMDPYNLAICFGPTLVPVPEDQVQYQNLVNELVKNVIVHANDVFPARQQQQLGATTTDQDQDQEVFYDRNGFSLQNKQQQKKKKSSRSSRRISDNDDDDEEDDDEQGPPPQPPSAGPAQRQRPRGDSVGGGGRRRGGSRRSQEDEEEDEEEEEEDDNNDGGGGVVEAFAEFDFRARSGRELSFRKGDRLLLHGRVSTHWWRGTLAAAAEEEEAEGLIPDQYIAIVNKNAQQQQTQPANNKTRSLDRHNSGGGGRKKSLLSLAPTTTSGGKAEHHQSSSSPVVVVVPSGPSSAPTPSSSSSSTSGGGGTLKATPDLVMDLPEKTAAATAAPPATTSSSCDIDDAAAAGGGSNNNPVEVESIAEVFGLESQCTLLRKAPPPTTTTSTQQQKTNNKKILAAED